MSGTSTRLAAATALSLAALAQAQSAPRGPAKLDAGPPMRPSADREVIEDLDLLTNLEVLRDLEIYAPPDGGSGRAP